MSHKTGLIAYFERKSDGGWVTGGEGGVGAASDNLSTCDSSMFYEADKLDVTGLHPAEASVVCAVPLELNFIHFLVSLSSLCVKDTTSEASYLCVSLIISLQSYIISCLGAALSCSYMSVKSFWSSEYSKEGWWGD